MYAIVMSVSAIAAWRARRLRCLVDARCGEHPRNDPGETRSVLRPAAFPMRDAGGMPVRLVHLREKQEDVIDRPDLVDHDPCPIPIVHRTTVAFDTLS